MESDAAADQQIRLGEGKQTLAQPDVGAHWETVAQVGSSANVWDFHFMSHRRNLLNCMYMGILLFLVFHLIRRGYTCHRPLFLLYSTVNI